MKSLRTYLIVMLAVLLGGCGTIPLASPPQPLPQHAEASPRVISTGPRTVTEVIQACARVQASRDLPIACSVKYSNRDEPILFIGFPSMSSAADADFVRYVIKTLGSPFCSALQSSNREGFVFLYVADEGMHKFYSCEQQSWTNWSNK